MDVFEMVVWIVAICAFCDLTIKIRKQGLTIQSSNEAEQKEHQELTQRLEEIEKRMANLETIVLDLAKQSDFDRALKQDDR